jgi:hypothetical protein
VGGRGFGWVGGWKRKRKTAGKARTERAWRCMTLQSASGHTGITTLLLTILLYYCTRSLGCTSSAFFCCIHYIAAVHVDIQSTHA